MTAPGQPAWSQAVEAAGRWRTGLLSIDSHGDNGVTGRTSSTVGRGDEHDLREEIRWRLSCDITGLVGG
ncbi:MAG TPA: hypothetical protein VG123_40490 [Streptosporangiaceae bacterium]|nr:hypothetical protein [Streptosporangiaceae bacterium]